MKRYIKANSDIERAIKDGYPRKIRGNDGYVARLVGIQPLFDGEYLGVYRYPGGDACQDLEELEYLVERGVFEILEQ